jgi:hypothetical protein
MELRTYSAFRVNGEFHFQASVERRHVGDLFEPERLQLERVDGNGRVADEAELRFPDGQVVDGVLVSGSDETRILKFGENKFVLN